MIELVKKESPEGIWVGDMKDGDIGVIVNWEVSGYSGLIVQRRDNDLIIIGDTDGWSVVTNVSKNCRVRLLKKGEILIVT